MPEVINPNANREFIKTVDINSVLYPSFFNKIKFDKFRHIENLEVPINSPITIISGSNKSGKTTILLSIACSHYNFKRRNLINGSLERNRWGDIIRFTKFDKQIQDWTYHVDYREGARFYNKRGQRKNSTNKWNGVAKKESQIGTPSSHKPDGGRSVVMIDLERIFPGRALTQSLFNKIKKTVNSDSLSKIKVDYLSYILEQDYEIGSVFKFSDKEIFKFKSNENEYSSFNTASGEDVLTRLITDIVDAENNSLILIEEIEIGLHPKIQRRLLDIIHHESKKNKKQFIITTHSPTILSCVEQNSRIFIENNNGSYRSIPKISVNAAFSKMDSLSYPLLNLFVEDELAEKIVNKAIEKITYDKKITNFKDLINIIKSGSANNTYTNFIVHKRTFDFKKLDCGYACILDGDQRSNYSNDFGLYFLYSNESPERFLVKEYLRDNHNVSLKYHLNSNPHCLFSKMVDFNICMDKNAAFEKCWSIFVATVNGSTFLNSLCDFIIENCLRFSPEL